MRRIVVWMSVSLDGFMEGPNHNLDWHQVDEELHAHFNEHLRAMSAFLNGRTTYELMADFWPTADAEHADSPTMVDFAGIWRDMPKIVYSTTLQDAGWKTTIVPEVDPEQVRALQAQPGGDMALGGADLAASFLEHDLIDEYRLYVHPVAIGAGTPLFPAGVRVDVQLAETKTFGNGVVLLRYNRRG